MKPCMFNCSCFLVVLAILLSSHHGVEAGNGRHSDRNHYGDLKVNEDILSTFQRASHRKLEKEEEFRHFKEQEEQTAKKIESRINKLVSPKLDQMFKITSEKIVEKIIRPVINAPERLRATSFGKNDYESSSRLILSNFGSIFKSEYVSIFLAQQWFHLITGTGCWILAAGLYHTLGNDNMGRSAPQEPWETLIPNSNTLTFIFRELADATEKYSLHHDEL
ncbi:uncharacterized protein [Lepeophtheirus salmonis]|uniref:uncharacterized protein n=1 Tax=Lepeophtheirus salmonis TaxID=72036 RepID=UPI001AE98AE6|nr:uncharacterized protein LOC121122477 [Lepeophtheirus salmonis]